MSAEPACDCKSSDLGYIAWQSDAERRSRAGQRQVWCSVCKLWRWPDEVGTNAVTLNAKQHKAMLKKEKGGTRCGT